MAQYIDKNALLEYLNKLYEKHSTRHGMDEGGVVIDEIEYFIDTLEVKEVDLEKEIDFAMPPKYCWSGDGEAVYTKEQMRNFAKHFFELGLKVNQKGE